MISDDDDKYLTSNEELAMDMVLEEEEDEKSDFDFCGDQLDNSTQINLHADQPLQKIGKYTKHITPRHKIKKKKLKMMDWKTYHRLGIVYAFLDELERDFPAICTVSVIGKSVEGRDIRMLKVSNSNASNYGVWLDGSIHPREWITTSVVTFIADRLVRNFDVLPKYFTNKDWHFIPILNPDGYEYTHTDNRMWRKNKACHNGVCVGVDLNRNFSFGWGLNGDEGSSNVPTNVLYRGPEPFSEPESVAVRDTILSSTTEFKVFLSFHSYYELIIFPWGHTPEPCPTYLNLLEAGIEMAKGIFEVSGKTYKVGGTKDMTYFACGTSTDWSYAMAKIPYSYMVELRSRKHRFRLPRSQIMETCLEIWNAMQNLMQYVDRHPNPGESKKK